MFKLLFIFLTVTFLIESLKIPPNFKKCDRKQADFNDCLFKAVKHALPQLAKPYKELNLPSFAPLEVTQINIGVAKDKVTLKQTLNNCKLFGSVDAKIDKFEIDFDDKALRTAAVYPEIKAICDYKMEGKILFVPIVGEGVTTTTLDNFVISFNLSFVEKPKSGKTYISMTNGTIEGIPEMAHFQVDNLFNGDKELGDRMNVLLNENWKEIYEEVQHEYLESTLQIVKGVIDQFFSKVSLEDAFDS